MSEDRTSSGGSDEDRLLVAEYALGLLSADEHRRVTERLPREPHLAAELRFWRGRLSSLDADFTEATAPAGVLARVEERLFAGSRRRRTAGLWDSLALWRGLAAAGLAAAVIAIGFNLAQPPRLDPDEFATELVAALQAQEGSGVEFVALYDTQTGMVRITALSGSAVADRDYELWMIEESGTPVSMGVISMARTEIALAGEMKGHLVPGIQLAVTLEPRGGSPTGGPTGPVVAAGHATQI